MSKKVWIDGDLLKENNLGVKINGDSFSFNGDDSSFAFVEIDDNDLYNVLDIVENDTINYSYNYDYDSGNTIVKGAETGVSSSSSSSSSMMMAKGQTIENNLNSNTDVASVDSSTVSRSSIGIGDRLTSDDINYLSTDVNLITVNNDNIASPESTGVVVDTQLVTAIEEQEVAVGNDDRTFAPQFLNSPYSFSLLTAVPPSFKFFFDPDRVDGLSLQLVNADWIKLSSLENGGELELNYDATNVQVVDLSTGISNIVINLLNSNGDIMDSADLSIIIPDGVTNKLYVGSLGNDSIDLTGSSNNLIYAGDGNDTIVASGGNNIIYGGDGSDTLSYATSAVGVTANLTNGTGTDTLNSVENLLGSAFADTLTGDAGNNTIDGGAGNDTLDGGDGNDILDGGAGADTVKGGAGDDTIIFDILDTLMNGETGTDTLVFKGSLTVDFAGSGSGTFFSNPNALANVEFFDLNDALAQTIEINSGRVVTFTDLSNTLYVQGGAEDSVVLNVGGPGGGLGTSFASSGAPVTIGGVTYQEYSDGAGVSIFIDTDITVTVLGGA